MGCVEMRTILGFAAFMLVAFAVFGANAHTSTVSGVATDHAHVVSRETFLQVLRERGASTTNWQQAYTYTTDACNVIMRARWQDRPTLGATYPASIQDVTVRTEVYSAIASTVVCVP